MTTTNKRKTEPPRICIQELAKSEVEKYGTSIPMMLKGILTELVMARLERG